MTFVVGMEARLDASDVERGAVEAKTAIASIGPAAAVSGAEAATATRHAAHELTNLSYQMNDVATMLISGQSPFLIMAQQGLQVSQIMGRRGLGQILPALGAGLASMLTPTTLVLAGVTALGYGVAALFGTMNDEGEKAEKVLAEHAKLIRDVTDEWGDAVPALKAYLDELERAGKLSDLREAGSAAVENLWKDARQQIAGVSRDVDQLLDGLDLVGRSDAATTLAESWTKLADKVDAGTARSEDAKEVQTALNAVMDDGGEIARDLAAELDRLAGALDTVSDKSARIASDIARAQNPLQQFHEATTESMRAYEQAVSRGASFIADQERRNALTREQLALETEIERIKREAVRSGALVSDADARRLAESSLAADQRRSTRRRTDPVGDLIRSQSEDLSRLLLENAAIGQNAVQRQRALALMDAEIEIRKLGIDVNGQYAETIRDNAKATAELTAENERLADAYDTARSAGEGMIDGVLNKLRGGDLLGALDQITNALFDTLTKLAVANPLKNALFGDNLGTLSDIGGGGGLLSILFGGGFSDGGITAMIPGYTAGFDIGGWTGDGNPRRVAGYVHEEEFVVRAGPAKRHRPMLEAINRGRDPGYFEGGFAGQTWSQPAPSGSGAIGRPTGGNVYISIEDRAGVSVSQRRETSPDGDEMLTLMLDRVDTAIADGEFDNSFARYNGGKVRGDAAMTAVYPSGLPQYVLRDGFTEKPRWRRGSFEAEAGPPIEWPLATVDIRDLACAMVMRDFHIELLEDFVFRELGQGAMPFVGPHPRTREAWLLKFTGNPAPYEIRVRTGVEFTCLFSLLAIGSAS